MIDSGGLPDMLPRFALCNLPNSVVGQLQLFGNSMYGHGFVETSNGDNVGFGYCTSMAFFALPVMLTVIAFSHVHKIIGEIIKPVFINVMNFTPFGAWAEKSKGDKLMNIEFFSDIFSKKPEVMIAALNAKCFRLAMMRLSPPAFCLYLFWQAFYVTKITNLVQSFIAGDVAPFFGWKKRELWSMLSHVDTFLSRLSAVLRAVSAAPGLFASFYSPIIAQIGAIT